MRNAEKAHIQHWYSVCKSNIERLYGPDSRFFTNILAATSPRKQVKVNWTLANRVYNCVRAGKSIDNMPGLLPAHRLNVLRAVNNLPLSGRKVSAFADNLNGNLNPVTIDVWIKRHYPGLSDDEIKARIRRGAKRCGMAPAEYQAIIWTKARIKAGRRAVSYNCVPDLFQMRMFD